MKLGLFSILCCVSILFKLSVKSENISIEFEDLNLNNLVKLALDSSDVYQRANESYKMEYGNLLVRINDEIWICIKFQ